MKIFIMSLTVIVLVFIGALVAEEHSGIAKKFNGIYAVSNDVIIWRTQNGNKVIIPGTGIGVDLKYKTKRLWIDTGSYCGTIVISQVYAGHSSSLFAQGSTCKLNMF